VSKKRGPWEDGHRAWARLTAWHAGGRSGSLDSEGDAALEAMTDIGTLRRLLEQAELAAVRTARRQRKSWAEIATQLGITRQSAWERWRELDEEEATPTAEPSLEQESVLETDTVIADIASEMAVKISGEARGHRRRGKVVVPNVVGLRWDDARIALFRVGLLAASSDPDGPPLAALGWPNTVVVNQIPESGAKVPAGTQVWLELERGDGSAGVREPRRPSPAPKSGYEWRNEPSDEAVG